MSLRKLGQDLPERAYSDFIVRCSINSAVCRSQGQNQSQWMESVHSETGPQSKEIWSLSREANMPRRCHCWNTLGVVSNSATAFRNAVPVLTAVAAMGTPPPFRGVPRPLAKLWLKKPNTRWGALGVAQPYKGPCLDLHYVEEITIKAYISGIIFGPLRILVPV